ncbi:MAG: hypothetical protein M1823_008714, partial [Watsoniomyces obsoletus]
MAAVAVKDKKPVVAARFRLREAIEDLLKRAHGAGKLAGIYAATGERAAAFAAQGYNLIALGSDTGLLRAGAQAALKAARA